MARLWSFTLAAAALVAATVLTAAPAPVSAPQQTGGAASDPAAPLFTRMCVMCHEAARVTALRRTSIEWEETINKMIERGAQGTEQEFETVFAYLVKYFGKVRINGAPADEIQTVLGLTKKDADAIVAYRTANGPFADFEALKKVPGIDVKKLEELRDALLF